MNDPDRLNTAFLTLAQGSEFLSRIWPSMGGYYSRQGEYIKLAAIVAMILIFLGALAYRLWPLFVRRRTIERLFVSLAVANHLSSREGAVLRRAARHLQLRNPAEIFVRPSLLDRFELERGSADPSLAEPLASLRKKLYE